MGPLRTGIQIQICTSSTVVQTNVDQYLMFGFFGKTYLLRPNVILQINRHISKALYNSLNLKLQQQLKMMFDFPLFMIIK